MPYSNANSRRPRGTVDGRILVYRWVRRVGGLVLAAAAVKFLLFDTMVITTDQMAPELLPGDRVVVFRVPAHLRRYLKPRRGTTVVFRSSAAPKKFSCLRIAGIPGDTVELDSGRLLINRRQAKWGMPLILDVLPADYSPRDFTAPLRVPLAGDTTNLHNLTMRNFFFAASVIAQENEGKPCRIEPRLFINGEIVKDYVLEDFSLHKGPLDSVAPAREHDWFFWDRVLTYVRTKNPDRTIEIFFSLECEGRAVGEYRFKESCIFLLADDWEAGHDSRFFGPVALSRLRGTVCGILWSFDRRDDRWPGRPRIGRFGRLVRTRGLLRGKG